MFPVLAGDQDYQKFGKVEKDTKTGRNHIDYQKATLILIILSNFLYRLLLLHSLDFILNFRVRF